MIAKEKAFAPMYSLLYLQYMRQNRMNEAEQLLKLQMENNPQRANYVLQLAAFYYYTNRRPDMEAMMQRLTNEKYFHECYLLSGDFFFFGAGEFANAQKQYDARSKP